jgi:hypothetical protein
LESRAWKRYGRLDRLSNERNWYRDQYDALDALVEALRTDNGLLEYRLQVAQDVFLDQGAQVVEDASAVERVTTALRKAHEDLVVMRNVVTEWETEVASTRAQLQQDRATLEE